MKKILVSLLLIFSIGMQYGLGAQTNTRAVAPSFVLIKAGRLPVEDFRATLTNAANAFGHRIERFLKWRLS